MCQFRQVLFVSFKFIFDNNSNYFPFKQITHSIKTIESFRLIEPCTELACVQRTESEGENGYKKASTKPKQQTDARIVFVNESGDAAISMNARKRHNWFVDNNEIGIKNKREIFQRPTVSIRM